MYKDIVFSTNSVILVTSPVSVVSFITLHSCCSFFKGWGHTTLLCLHLHSASFPPAVREPIRTQPIFFVFLSEPFSWEPRVRWLILNTNILALGSYYNLHSSNSFKNINNKYINNRLQINLTFCQQHFVICSYSKKHGNLAQVCVHVNGCVWVQSVVCQGKEIWDDSSPTPSALNSAFAFSPNLSL